MKTPIIAENFENYTFKNVENLQRPFLTFSEFLFQAIENVWISLTQTWKDC